MASSFVVEGLADVHSNLIHLDDSVEAMRSKVLRRWVNATLLPRARRNLTNQGHIPNRPMAISALATKSEAGLRLKYSQHAWLAGAEYGSWQYRQFRPWVGNQYTGSENFPGYLAGAAFKATLATIENDIQDAIAAAIVK